MARLTVNKPWGKFEQFTHNQMSTVKILTVEPHQQLSLQYHHKREELWKVISGDCKVILGRKEMIAGPDDEFFIPKKAKHRIIGGAKTAKILEISFGEFDEEDIVRLEDSYGRVQ